MTLPRGADSGFNSASTLSSRRTRADVGAERRRARSFNSASTLSSRRTTRWRSPSGSRRKGFNSASTLSSRRTRGCGGTRCSRGPLQFGLDAVVEENLGLGGAFRVTPVGFNSASTLSSRRTLIAELVSYKYDPLQFGLDAVVEENGRNPAGTSTPGGRLQFGLDAVVEENLASTTSGNRLRIASIRPRRCRRGEP